MSPRIQFFLAVALAIGVAAYAVSDLWRVPMPVSMAAAALLVGGPALALWALTSRRSPSSALARTVAMIAELPLGEARIRAQKALEDVRHFDCTPAASPAAFPPGLPPAALELFSRFVSIASVSGEARLSRDDVGPSAYKSGWLRIGYDLDAVELAVRPDEDAVYEIDGSDPDEHEVALGGVPSVYHWILITEEVLYGETP